MAVISAPNDKGLQSLDEIAAAMRAGNSLLASALADAILAQGIEHPLPYQARALHLDKLGRGEEALANFLKARDLGPNDPIAANGVAICLGRLGRLEEAMAAFETALVLAPNLVTTHFHMGWILEMHREFAAACRAYKRAVELAPQYAAAWAGLATAAQGSQDWKQAQTAAKRALAIDPRQPRVILSLAVAEIQESQFGAAEAILRAALHAPGLMSRDLEIVSLGLLADALDGQGKTDEAFGAYTAENRERLAVALPPSMDMAVLVRDLTTYFERTYPESWVLPAAGDVGGGSAREHIFLMGFPRSGTTLVEQVLSAHRDVVTLEESDVLDPVAEEFLRDIAGLDRFASLREADLSQIREGYWRRVRTLGVETRGKVFVDKLPLNTIKLPLIAKLFPAAKVIFALRDPRDVVFSCFRRHFQVNASTYAFLSLERTARFYDWVMILGEICRKRLPLQFHLHRHEDLVRDFEEAMRRLCDFAGISWTERFQDFAQLARQRAIRSISAAQVRRGLNSDGMGQWRRYATHLQPVLPILQHWVELFGYEPT